MNDDSPVLRRQVCSRLIGSPPNDAPFGWLMVPLAALGMVATLPGRTHRGVMGKSSGGYGALVLGLLHPETFGAVACHSGDMCFEYCYRGDVPKALSQIQPAA